MSENKVIISCDSTADLSPELIERFGIKVNHLPVIMNDTPYVDGITITPADIFDYYKTTGQLAKTSAHNVQDYLDFFTPFVNEGYSVVHFIISSSMSASFNNARMAASELSGVYVIDSKNLSTGIGLQVLRAAELARDGMDAKSIAEQVSTLWERVDTSFILDTLQFLHKGGRCSSVAALGANLLKLKPCIEVKNGAMDVGKKYRGKLMDVLLEYTEARLKDIDDIELDRIFVTHTCGDNSDLVRAVREKVQQLAPFKEVLETQAGCSVSVHCGPNTLGVLFIRKTPLH